MCTLLQLFFLKKEGELISTGVDKSTKKPTGANSEQFDENDPQRKYLIADLRLGLTNQAVEAWISVLIAERLNRTLVLPQVHAKIPKGEIVAEESAAVEDFDYIWDSAHFINCAREKLDRPDLVFASDQHHYEFNIPENDTFIMNNYDGSNRIVPLLIRNPALPINDEFIKHLVENNATYVKVVRPFANVLARKWNYTDCIVPSQRIINMIGAYKSILPNEYACIHARTEADWFSRACCEKQGITTSHLIEEWTCPINTVSETCYKTPRQIADMLKSKIDSNTTIWVSSGSSRKDLQPLYELWKVVTTDDLVSEHTFMDYGLAQVDKAICSGATRFWGMGGSTFTDDIARVIRSNGGNVSMYAMKRWGQK